MKTEYEITNVGSPAFPKFEVRLNVIDEDGNDLEHLSSVIGYAPSYSEALTVKWKHEHQK